MTVEMALKVQKAMDHFNQGAAILSGGPASFYLERMTEITEEFFKRCSPLQKGDLVEIVGEIKCEDGWREETHNLSVGNRGVVESVDFYKGDFYADVRILNQRMKVKGELVPRSTQYLFSLKADLLKRVVGPEPVSAVCPVCSGEHSIHRLK